MVKPTEKEVTIIYKVERVVCKHFGVKEYEIVSKIRKSQVAMARGYIFFILHTNYNISSGKLSSYYDRTSRAIFWHINKISFLLRQRIYKEIFNQICSEL